MTKSICTYGYIPVRHEPSEKSEMTTQILFGETYEVMGKADKWLRIKTDFDSYEGWIDAKLHVSLLDSEVESWIEAPKWVAPGPFVKIVRDTHTAPFIIPGGSSIWFNGSDLSSFVIGNNEYYLTSNYSPSKRPGSIEEIAMTFFQAPYLWGGRSFYGLDCSGFTQIVNKIYGRTIPRDASQQVELGETINFVEEAKAGDLAFFDNSEGRVTHVGICLGGGEIIHSSGSVRIDKLDHQGIFSLQKQAYTHSLRVIKRLV